MGRLTPDVPQLRAMKVRGEKIAMLTAYDYPAARLLDEAGVDVLLVGDSLGMVVLGYPDTTLVTMDEMVHHTRAVARGATRALILGDMPYRSYETPELALENARRLIEAGAHAVKLEGGTARVPQIRALVAAGIPAMAHIGMMPQNVRLEGGYRIKGKTPEQAEALIADAAAVQAAGAFGILIELVVPEVARRITASVNIPTVGIGAGADCDGQVLVLHDLIGLFPWFTPKFAKPRARVADDIRRAVAGYLAATKSPTKAL
ncbi:MAG TPA: 3-methyl-2-oxobutanoate hydroxymethyltransferase [Chthoniobacteraceae bacterium]|nr:3-methyl-2-oxobutanoate hydroxymethyltransferase [Chthoniobacteraceae bacterium]